jgi:phosphopentomutase
MIKTRHIFMLSKLLDKIGMDEDLKNVLAGASGKASESEIGTQIILSLGKKIHKAQKEIVDLLADVTGKTAEQIEDLPVKETMELVRKMLSEEGVLDFLHSQLEDTQ